MFSTGAGICFETRDSGFGIRGTEHKGHKDYEDHRDHRDSGDWSLLWVVFVSQPTKVIGHQRSRSEKGLLAFCRELQVQRSGFAFGQRERDCLCLETVEKLRIARFTWLDVVEGEGIVLCRRQTADLEAPVLVRPADHDESGQS